MNAKIIANIFVVLTALACLGTLAMSIYPGVLSDLFLLVLLFIILPMIPIFGLLVVAVIVIWIVNDKLLRFQVPWAQLFISLLILNVTYVGLKFYVPMRIAFAVSQSAFQSFLPRAVPSHGTPLNKWLGVYRVDEYASDPRGGVYFRVYRGSDGIGPDVMSYGFCHRPNSMGTPFGAKNYCVFDLGDDWYWFYASDDYY